MAGASWGARGGCGPQLDTHPFQTLLSSSLKGMESCWASGCAAK